MKTQAQIVRDLLTEAALALREQAQAFNDTANMVTDEFADRQGALVIRSIMVTAIGAVEVVKTVMLKRMLKDLIELYRFEE